MKPVVLSVVGLCAAGLVTGCGPKRSAALEQARLQYAQANANPLIVNQAPVPLRDARTTLTRADAALNDGDLREVQHLSYVAEQQIEIAKARAAAELADRQAARLHEQALRNARETDRGLVYTVPDVLFEFDEARLKAGASRELAELVAFLRRHPQRDVIVEGHTDAVGGEAYNARLSRDRAAAVEAFLVREGLDPDRIVSQGYGEEFPVASNADAGGRQLNRRVEVVILRPGEVASRHMR